MKSLKSIRNELGITQTEMARLLNISRSLVALVETGLRELPTASLIILSKMAIAVNKNGEEIIAEKKTVDDYLISQLQRYSDECLYQAKMLERKLDKMRHNSKCRHLLGKIVNGIKQEFTPDTGHKAQFLQAEILSENVNATNSNALSIEKELIAIKISALYAEIEIIKNKWIC